MFSLQYKNLSTCKRGSVRTVKAKSAHFGSTRANNQIVFYFPCFILQPFCGHDNLPLRTSSDFSGRGKIYGYKHL